MRRRLLTTTTMFSSSWRRSSTFFALFLVFLVTVVYLRVSLKSVLVSLPIREQEFSSDATSTTAATTTSIVSSNKQRKRTFLRYESSPWERQWLDRIGSLNDLVRNDTLCDFMESKLIKRFMLALCTSSRQSWCVVNDTYRPIYVDIETGYAQQKPPKGVIFPDPKPITTFDLPWQIFSRFVYLDEQQGQEYFEYIEPLVGYLRHPLCCCEHKYKNGASFRPIRYPQKACFGWLRTTRTHIVPAAHPSGGTSFDKYWYFDAGASDWSSGLGGPSLSYFTEIWKRQGIEFDGIYAWEGTTNVSAFYETVPEEYRSRVHYDQTFVRSKLKHDARNPNGPFIPEIIQQVAEPEDYVLFKLDIDSPGVEEGNIEFLLDPVNGILDYVDEFFYEFHSDDLPIWYRNFLALRKAGVRAHSWI